jgi:hypothetical protein
MIYTSDLYSQDVIAGTSAELAEAFAATPPDGGIGLAYIPRKRQVIVNTDTGEFFVGNGTTRGADLTPLPGGGGSSSFDNWLYGDGSQGAHVATDGEYFRSGFYTDYTIPLGVTVKVPRTYGDGDGGVVEDGSEDPANPPPFILYCTGTFTINGTLDMSSANSVGRLDPSGTGSITGDASTGAGGITVPHLAFFADGAGGSGAAGAGDVAPVARPVLRNPLRLLTYVPHVGGFSTVSAGGNGAGDNTNYGGSGGAPGRWCVIVARHIVHGGTNVYNLQGGNGGDAGDDGTGSTGHGDCGGGGGGAGGWWVTISDTLTGSAVIVGHGGTGGTGCGTGTNGTNGQDGTGIHYVAA